MTSLARRPRRPGRQAGFTLLSVLVAIAVMALGLLGMVRAMVGVTSAATQNQAVSAVASLSNGLWGVIQFQKQATVVGWEGTWSDANKSSWPSDLQTWLGQYTNQMPGGSVTLDVADTTCATAATHPGCNLTATMTWTQVGAASGAMSSRSQTFYYAF